MSPLHCSIPGKKIKMEDHRPRTLVELLKQAVAARPDREALRFKQDKAWVGMTAERLLERVRLYCADRSRKEPDL